MEDMMSRLFLHIYTSDNITIQSNTNKGLLLQEDPNSTNTVTKALCSKSQGSFKSCELSHHNQISKDVEPTDNDIKSTLVANKELSNNNAIWGNHSIYDLK